MAQNLALDPTKKDYVLSLSGSSVPSDDVTTAVYYALAIPQDQWLYGDPNQGSKLYTLNNVKRSGSVEQQISSYSIDAVERQVIATGQATAAQMQNVEATRTGSSNQLEVIPSTTQVSTQLAFTAV